MRTILAFACIVLSVAAHAAKPIVIAHRGASGYVPEHKAIGVHKNLMIPLAADGSLGAPTTLVRDAHARRLLVHGWTFRAENYFLPKDFRSGDDERAKGDLEGELERFLALGMDGFFIDQPDIGVRALK
jgi:glycerophosphoryl diester phosphodiesterase